jgi:hypothetical protein
MKLADFILIALLLVIMATLKINSNSTNPKNNTLSPALTPPTSANFVIHEVIYDYLNSTKITLSPISDPTSLITAYLSSQDLDTSQFDLIQKVRNSSKIMASSLLIIDLASAHPYATLQSN